MTPNIGGTIRLLASPGLQVMFLRFQRPTADWFALTLFVLATIIAMTGMGSQRPFGPKRSAISI